MRTLPCATTSHFQFHFLASRLIYALLISQFNCQIRKCKAMNPLAIKEPRGKEVLFHRVQSINKLEIVIAASAVSVINDNRKSLTFTKPVCRLCGQSRSLKLLQFIRKILTLLFYSFHFKQHFVEFAFYTRFSTKLLFI